ncbi:DUF7657 domain-containing protein [Vandammella animalimorsus]|uniref:Uncharacterized protein n=1 Tax=Vandammella animalimorsus TaxID=2029117 RepID=A0A2A2AFC5_9BURK|nr:hypothetical protein [Vandammella animalimorsus]PAT37265.1 hypothetical protein CK625_06485 [Vandammella animalimorsus]
MRSASPTMPAAAGCHHSRRPARPLLPVRWLMALLLALALLAGLGQARAVTAPEAIAATAPSQAIPAETQQQQAGQAFLESVQLDAQRRLTLSGWAGLYHGNAFITQATVWVGDTAIYTGRLGYALDRPGVAQHTGRALWQSSGFSLPVRIPAHIAAGPARLRMQVLATDGSRIDVVPLHGSEQIDIPPATQAPAAARWMLGLALALPLLAWCLGLERPRRAAGLPPSPTTPAQASAALAADAAGARRFGLALLASLALLVGAGWTGSSLPLLLEQANRAAPLVAHDAQLLYGQAQAVRSDEWLVVTPLAISQAHATPRWPGINPLHGWPGQNMHVVGMTGVPIAHWATLARPATWGFFVLPLRQALAWAWWLPFFLCFATLWWLLRRTFALPWRQAALLATSVSASGYAVSWSGWPAYAIGLAAAVTLAAQQLLRSRGPIQAGLAAVALGWAGAALVLLLYPAWQVPLGYLMALLGLAWAWQQRQQLPMLQAPQWRALGLTAALAALTAAALLLAWLNEGGPAIEALRQTIYPGARSTDLGGYVDPWHLLKGMTNLVTLHTSSLWSIPSDSGGYIYVLPPLALATALRCWALRRVDAMALALWLFIAWLLAYMFIGLPGWLSKASLWSLAPAFRTDIALGLAQALVLAWLLAPANQPTTGQAWQQAPRWLALLAGLGFAWHTHQLLGMQPLPSQDWLLPGSWWLICALAGLIAAWLVRGQIMQAVTLLCLWGLATALPFNPLGLAPSHLRPAPALQQALSDWPAAAPSSGQASSTGPRLAVVSEPAWANALAASGVAVLNTTFYEPPLALWQRLDPQQQLREQYNRYQHLHIVLQPQPSAAAGWSAAAPNMDRVELRLDPQRFDFRLLPIDAVLANWRDAGQLQANPSLQERARQANASQTADGAQDDGWVLFAVQSGQ